MELLVLGLVVLALVWWFWRQKGRPARPRRPREETEDFNEKFLRQHGNDPGVALVRTYNPEDLMLLRSLLDSSQINTWAEFAQMNSLLPGVVIPGHTDVVVYVGEDDLDEARTIVADYIETLRSGNVAHLGDIMRNLAEFSLGGYAQPNRGGKALPELLVDEDEDG